MKKLIISIALVSVLVGCGKRADEPENSASAAGPAATPMSVDPSSAATPSTAKVTFEPAEFESCSPNKFVTAKVSWDATPSGAAIVDIKTIGADGTETLFATAGAVGSKETGPWIGPGSAIVVRNHDTGAELGRGVAAAKPCAP